MGNDTHVVIVDDDELSRETLGALLAGSGYHVRAAGSAAEAMIAIAEHDPVCVVLDLMMPAVGGAELALRIRARWGRELVLIALTGSADVNEHEAAESAGVDHVWLKPVDPRRMTQMFPPSVSPPYTP